MEAERATPHLHASELRWFEYEPTDLVAAAGEDNHLALANRLAVCRRAAWRCDAYLAFTEVGPGGVADTVMVWSGSEEYAVDLDRQGAPVGVEFISRLPCSSD